MFRVSKYFIKYLIDKYENKEPFDESELDHFWSKNKSKFTVCDNTQGNCVVEEFKNLDSVYAYFSMEKPLEEIMKEDKTLTYQRKKQKKINLVEK